MPTGPEDRAASELSLTDTSPWSAWPLWGPCWTPTLLSRVLPSAGPWVSLVLHQSAPPAPSTQELGQGAAPTPNGLLAGTSVQNTALQAALVV